MTKTMTIRDIKKEIKKYYEDNKVYFDSIAEASPYWHELDGDDINRLAKKYIETDGQMDLQGEMIWLMQWRKYHYGY